MVTYILKFSLPLVVLGLLAIPSLVLAKKPDAKVLFDKVAPYQGIIGIIVGLWGIWGIVECIRWIELLLKVVPVLWATLLAGSVVMVLLGFILGYGLISKHALSKNEQAAAKGEALLQKLLPLQGKLGLVSIALGIWSVIAVVIFL